MCVYVCVSTHMRDLIRAGNQTDILKKLKIIYVFMYGAVDSETKLMLTLTKSEKIKTENWMKTFIFRLKLKESPKISALILSHFYTYDVC